MSITTEEAKGWAQACDFCRLPSVATALRSLADERDALKAENEVVQAALRRINSSITPPGEIALQAENARLRAALLLARVAVSHACELSDRILYTQELVRIDAALGEKE